MADPSVTPRRFPRVKLHGNVTGAISFLQDVTLLDLSERRRRSAASPPPTIGWMQKLG